MRTRKKKIPGIVRRGSTKNAQEVSPTVCLQVDTQDLVTHLNPWASGEVPVVKKRIGFFFDCRSGGRVGRMYQKSCEQSSGCLLCTEEGLEWLLQKNMKSCSHRWDSNAHRNVCEVIDHGSSTSHQVSYLMSLTIYFSPYLWVLNILSVFHLKALPTDVEDTISRDLARTFPDMRRFTSVEGQESLGRVLRAYAAYDPEVGYCQVKAFTSSGIARFG